MVTMPKFASFYCLLVVVPETTECYETMHILKYFDFPINVEEDNIVRQQVKLEMGFRKEDQVFQLCMIYFQYPLMIIDSSSEEMPNAELTT